MQQFKALRFGQALLEPLPVSSIAGPRVDQVAVADGAVPIGVVVQMRLEPSHFAMKRRPLSLTFIFKAMFDLVVAVAVISIEPYLFLSELQILDQTTIDSGSPGERATCRRVTLPPGRRRHAAERPRSRHIPARRRRRTAARLVLSVRNPVPLEGAVTRLADLGAMPGRSPHEIDLSDAERAELKHTGRPRRFPPGGDRPGQGGRLRSPTRTGRPALALLPR